jgi:uncharacterized protein
MAEGDFFYYEPSVVVRRRRSSELRRPNLTLGLIILCSSIFLAGFFIPLDEEFAFRPALSFAMPWTYVTSIFLHASFEHLFFNMFALFVFGTYLETRVSPSKYLTVFFAAGILGNVAYLLTDPTSIIPGVGASGAIYGIMGMLAMLYPGLIVYVFYAPMPIIVAAGLWFILEFTGLFTPSDIAHQAHLAGLLLGAAYGYYLRRRMQRPVFFWEKGRAH